jgi:hypothetical protein
MRYSKYATIPEKPIGRESRESEGRTQSNRTSPPSLWDRMRFTNGVVGGILETDSICGKCTDDPVSGKCLEPGKASRLSKRLCERVFIVDDGARFRWWGWFSLSGRSGKMAEVEGVLLKTAKETAAAGAGFHSPFPEVPF